MSINYNLLLKSSIYMNEIPISEPSECIIIGDLHSRLQGVNFIKRKVEKSNKKSIIVIEGGGYFYNLLNEKGKLKPENLDELIKKLKGIVQYIGKRPLSSANINDVKSIITCSKTIDLLEDLSELIKSNKVTIYFPEAAETENNNIKDIESALKADSIQFNQVQNYVAHYLQKTNNLTDKEKDDAIDNSHDNLFRDIKLFLFLSKIIKENPGCLIMPLYGVDHSKIIEYALQLEHLQVKVENSTCMVFSKENIDIVINEQIKLLQKYINISNKDIRLWKNALKLYLESAIAWRQELEFINGKLAALPGFKEMGYDLVEFYEVISGKKLSEEDRKRIYNYANILLNVERPDLIPEENEDCHSPRHGPAGMPASQCQNERKRTEKKNALRGNEETLVHQMTNKAQNKLREEWKEKQSNRIAAAKSIAYQATLPTPKPRQNQLTAASVGNSQINQGQPNWREQVRNAVIPNIAPSTPPPRKKAEKEPSRNTDIAASNSSPRNANQWDEISV